MSSSSALTRHPSFYASNLFFTLLAIVVALNGILLITAWAAWFLLSRQLRRRVLIWVDAVLLLAIVAVYADYFWLHKFQHNQQDVGWAAARLSLVTLFCIRLLVYALPFYLHFLENFGFALLIAARHLRAKKSGFIGAIAVLSILAVSVSSCALATTLSVMGGFRSDLRRKIIGNSAHITIDRADGPFENWSPVAGNVKRQPGVVALTPVVRGEVMVSSATNLAGAIMRGVDSRTAPLVIDLERNLIEGKLRYLDHPEAIPSNLEQLPDDLGPALDDDATRRNPRGLQQERSEAEESAPVLPGVIVGKELARSLRLAFGDELNVVSPLGSLGPTGPIPKSRAFRVAGIFYSGMYEYDVKTLYVSKATAQSFLNLNQGVTSLEVRTTDLEKAPQIASAIRNEFKNNALKGSAPVWRELRVRDWKELNKTLFGALALEKLAMFIALGIAVLVASFCIIGTLTLMVQEKGPAIGVLKALGADDRTVIRIFMLEGLLIGVFGALSGLGLGYVVCFFAKHFGVRMNPEVYYIDRLPIHIDPWEFMLVGLAAALVSLIVTIYPSLLASRIRPVEALRYE